MIDKSTIVAIATPPGRGGIAVVRVSGPDAIRIADAVFRGRRKPSLAPSHTVLYGTCVDPDTGEEIDEVLILVMRGPKTYTTEDTVEFQCHGGGVASRRIMDVVIKAGARPAYPGEFTLRAFIGGRIDLAQAEAVLDIVSARTVEEYNVALRTARGYFSDRVRGLRRKVIDLLTMVEASLDFADEEDISWITEDEILSRINRLEKELESLLSAMERGRVIRAGGKIVIAGPPNAGKSTLFNTLLMEEKAIVTPEPGTTRDIVEGWLNVGGTPVLLMDTAGLREAKGIVEKMGVEKAKRAVMEAELVLYVVDGSIPGEVDLMDVDCDCILVLNKMDKGISAKWDRALDWVEISAISGEGIDKLIKMIEDKFSPGGGEGEILPGRDRYISAVKRAISLLKDVRKAPSMDALASDLRGICSALGELLGEGIGEDVLKEIFSRFCVGK